MWSQHINCRRCSSTPPTRRYRKEILSWIVCVCTVLFFATDTQEIIESFVFQRGEKKQALHKEFQMKNTSPNHWTSRIKLQTSHLAFILDYERKVTLHWISYKCVRASCILFNNCPTRCDLFSLLHFCRQLYMFRVLTHIIRSWYSCNYSFWYWLTAMSKIRCY